MILIFIFSPGVALLHTLCLLYWCWRRVHMLCLVSVRLFWSLHLRPSWIYMRTASRAINTNILYCGSFIFERCSASYNKGKASKIYDRLTKFKDVKNEAVIYYLSIPFPVTIYSNAHNHETCICIWVQLHPYYSLPSHQNYFWLDFFCIFH